MLARQFFEIGKQQYMHFDFDNSVRNLKYAVKYETANSLKAEYLIYLGANYFYKKDIQSAQNCFSRAKMYNSKIKPSRSEFPGEIIKLFMNSN